MPFCTAIKNLSLDFLTIIIWFLNKKNCGIYVLDYCPILIVKHSGRSKTSCYIQLSRIMKKCSWKFTFFIKAINIRSNIIYVLCILYSLLKNLKVFDKWSSPLSPLPLWLGEGTKVLLLPPTWWVSIRYKFLSCKFFWDENNQ